ncbi:hypothetical protein FA15DRAFT_585553 [Coprinopsis marcescibilis]|uniref:SMODS and SLOG-associating 2TM effector domain-containing protein n=1 Tax=Coprinopsis marcescibilis TaxID=230819 RepID=A0A5C3L561_COPMA|nr:hypothetical protein FA15DRAFT_585553 [Coprinopsis marcescibilis]
MDQPKETARPVAPLTREPQSLVPQELQPTPADGSSSGQQQERDRVYSSQDKLLDSAPASVTLDHRDRPLSASRYPDLPPVPRSHDTQGLRRGRTTDTIRGRAGSGIDWIVPLDEKTIVRPRTVAERLQPTLDTARTQKDALSIKAKRTGWTLNIAIGLQVLLGSLTTGLSAVATTGRETAVQTTILGGLTTIIASYLARQRGSNELELWIIRVKDLEKFIREVEAYILDYGHLSGPDFDGKIEYLRNEYEEILGNGKK